MENCSHSYSLLSVITHSIATMKLRSFTSRVSDWPKATFQSKFMCDSLGLINLKLRYGSVYYVFNKLFEHRLCSEART